MVDVGFDHAIQGVGDVVVSLGRGGIDHVQVDVVETSRAGLTSCREGAAGGVRTLQHAQHILRGGLHAQRHAVVAGFTDASEKLGRSRFRVRLGGDLRAVGKPESIAHRRQDPR